MMFLRFIGTIFLICGVLFSAAFAEVPKLTGAIDIKADVFSFDAKINALVASGNVVVKRQDVVIRARRGYYDQVKQVVTLFDHVVLTRREMRLVCDRIVLKGRENQVLASGNAKFDFKGTQGRSNTISYDISRDQVFLDGNAVARQGQDEIAGEHVWVDLKRLYFRANHRALIRLSEDRLPN